MATQLRNWAAMAFAFSCLWRVEVACGKETEIPQPLIADLGSDGFAEREKAQEELSTWAIKESAVAIPELRRQVATADDPEIRVRCMEILKGVVLAREYLGEGYLGIALQEIETKVPGDPLLRRGVSITVLMEGTAAALGGLKVGDVIVGVDHQIWRGVGMKDEFPVFIRKLKPGTVIEVKLLIDGELVSKKVTLGEKPAGVNPSTIDDLEAANRAAKELFFRRWLDKQEAVPR